MKTWINGSVMRDDGDLEAVILRQNGNARALLTDLGCVDVVHRNEEDIKAGDG